MKKTTERGRPRQFDKQQALQQALQVFAAKGYEGTSLDDLTAAMGINRPSLYAAFGNKEALFLEALKAYTQPHDQAMAQALSAAPTAREAFAQLLQTAVENHLGHRDCQQRMSGCVMVNSTILSASDQQCLDQSLRQLHDGHEQMMAARLQQGVAAGDLPPDTDVQGLAQFFNGVLQGMAVLARAQQSEAALRSMARIALRVLD